MDVGFKVIQSIFTALVVVIVFGQVIFKINLDLK
jgi:hypothetical protein